MSGVLTVREIEALTAAISAIRAVRRQAQGARRERPAYEQYEGFEARISGQDVVNGPYRPGERVRTKGFSLGNE